MIESNIKASFDSNIERVWDIVTNTKEYSWRSDLNKIEILDNGNKFIEYAKNNFPTTFIITEKEDFKCYEFDIENRNLKGHWIGIFRETADGKTEIDFTEEIEVSNPIMKLLAKSYLKKQQQTYIRDLNKKLENI